MSHRTVDLSSHLNRTVTRGHPADFPVALTPLFCSVGDAHRPVPHRLAVLRADTGEILGVVSDRYRVVEHQRILDTVEQALAPLDVGPVPRGIYVDRRGARMRAVFKFPALARAVGPGDEICPCLKLQNSYDGTSRVTVQIGAFRFVCTNLAVGGGGVFAGGFMAVHAGEIALDAAAAQLAEYLAAFDRIVQLYHHWSTLPLADSDTEHLLDGVRKRTAAAIRQRIAGLKEQTVFAAYNAATYHATHRMRSYRTAFDLLRRVNRNFQRQCPLARAA